MEIAFKKKTAEKEKPSIETMMVTWPECFYREGDAAVRLALLNEADKQGLTKEDNVIRRQLLEKRYPAIKKAGKMTKADVGLRLWLTISFAGDTIKGDKVARRSEKDILKEAKILGLDSLQGDQAERLLYRELYHIAFLYFNLSMGDKQYSSIILGFGHMSDKKVAQKLARDLAKVAVFVPDIVKFPHYEIWKEALCDAYRDGFPDEVDYLELLLKGREEQA